MSRADLAYQPWPLPALPHELVNLCNRLAGRELRLGFNPGPAKAAAKAYIRPDISRLASEYMRGPASPDRVEAADGETSLTLKLENERWRVRANGLAAGSMLNAAKHILPEGIKAEELPDELRLALFGLCLESCLQHASTALGLAVTLEDVDAPTETAPGAATLKLPFDLEDEAGKLTGKGTAEIPFSSASLRMLLSICRALPGKKNRLEDLRLPLSLCACRGMFTLKLLREAATGDILLFEQAWRPESCMAEICGAVWQGSLTQKEDSAGMVFTFTAPVFDQSGNQGDPAETLNKEISMDNQGNKPGNATQNSVQDSATNGKVDINELEVRLTLELEERLISIRELSALAPGYTFVTAASPDNPVKLKINGKTVGKGQMVDVGGRLGVLVSALNLVGTAAE